MLPKNEVPLSDGERSRLNKLVKTGEAPARVIRRAQILLKSDTGWNDEKIREAQDVAVQTVENVRRQYVKEGLEAVLNARPGRHAGAVPRALDGKAEAQLSALACSAPPEGYARWTLRLLSERMVKLEYVEAVSYETVRLALKKMNLSLGSRPHGASRPSKTRPP